MQEGISVVTLAISKVFELVGTCFNSFNCWSVIFGMILTMLIYRLVLAPVVGGVFRAGQSDMVKKVRSSGSSRKTSSQKGENE